MEDSGLSALSFVIVVLAVWRVSVIIAQDEGPFSVFERVRGRIDPNQSTWLGRGVRCVGCVSFWVALVALILLDIPNPIWVWLGVAGGAMLIHRIVK